MPQKKGNGGGGGGVRVDLQKVLLIRGKVAAGAAAGVHRVGCALGKITAENQLKISWNFELARSVELERCTVRCDEPFPARPPRRARWQEFYKISRSNHRRLHKRRHSSAINFLGPTTRSGLLAAAGATCDDDTPRAAGPTAWRRLFCPPLHLGVQPPRPPARVRGRACRRRLLRCWRKAPLSRHVTQKRGPRSWPEGRKSLHSCVTNCGDDIRLIAFITNLGPIRKILMHLGEPLESPPLSPAHRAAVSGGVKVAVLTDVR